MRIVCKGANECMYNTHAFYIKHKHLVKCIVNSVATYTIISFEKSTYEIEWGNVFLAIIKH